MDGKLRRLLKKSENSVGVDAYTIPLQEILIQGVEDSSQPILIADMRYPEMPLIYVNKAFTTVTGYEQEEVIGQNCRFLQGENTDPKKVDEIRKAISEKSHLVVEMINYRKDGQPFYNRLSLVPIFNQAKELTHYLGIQSDVTAEKELAVAQERSHAMKHTMEAVNDITGNLLNHMTLILDQLKQNPHMDEDLLTDMSMSLGQAKDGLDKINAMKAYSEKQYNESIFMIDYEVSDGEDD